MTLSHASVSRCRAALASMMFGALCAAAAVAEEQHDAPPPGRIVLPGVYPKLAGENGLKLANTGWLKYCADRNGQRLCNTYRARYEGPDFLAVLVALTVRDRESTPALSVMMSRVRLYPARNIYPAPGISIDDQERLAARNVTCTNDSCGLTFDVTEEYLGKLKSGDVLTVVATDYVGRPFHRAISLNGFGAVYDGAPLDPKLLTERDGGAQ